MRTTLGFALAGVIAFGGMTGSVDGAAKDVTVFVGPNTTQQSPRMTAELTASVADLRKALKKRSSVRLVDTQETADVILIVQDRQRKLNLAGSGSWGDGGTDSSYNSWARLTVEVRGGGLSTPVVAVTKTWRGAASQVARDVAKWIDAYRRIPNR